jgi:hypothetical protein
MCRNASTAQRRQSFLDDALAALLPGFLASGQRDGQRGRDGNVGGAH